VLSCLSTCIRQCTDLRKCTLVRAEVLLGRAQRKVFAAAEKKLLHDADCFMLHVLYKHAIFTILDYVIAVRSITVDIVIDIILFVLIVC
jgi:hypothetical protein